MTCYKLLALNTPTVIRHTTNQRKKKCYQPTLSPINELMSSRTKFSPDTNNNRAIIINSNDSDNDPVVLTLPSDMFKFLHGNTKL